MAQKRQVINEIKYEKLKKDVPEFAKQVEDKAKINFCIVLITMILLLIIFLVTFYYLKSYALNISIFLSVIGAFLLAISNIRKPKSIVFLSTTRFGYNRDLANDLLSSSRNSAIGITLVIFGILIETIHVIFPNLLG